MTDRKSEEAAWTEARRRAVELATDEDDGPDQEFHLVEDREVTGVVALGRDGEGHVRIAVVWPPGEAACSGEEHVVSLSGRVAPRVAQALRRLLAKSVEVAEKFTKE